MSSEKIKKVLEHLEDIMEFDPYMPIVIEPDKDFSVLQDFTDEELAAELCRRTPLGKELE